MIDMQGVRGIPDEEWAARRAEIWAAWRESGIMIVEPPIAGDSFMGVPALAIAYRLRGGAGGGFVQEAVRVVVTLWPLAAAGYVGAVSADAWALTKRGLAGAFKRLLGKTAAEIQVEVADDSTDVRDDTYSFRVDDVSDIDRALGAMADKVRTRRTIEERRSTSYLWDRDLGEWVLDRRVETIGVTDDVVGAPD